MKRYSSYIALSRSGIALFAACSAATGYVLAAHRSSAAMIAPVLGVFLLGCGASALNQVQERRTDALMERTKKRPLPSGDMSLFHALTISLLFIVSGLYLLAQAGAIPFLIGCFALFWYNGLYTYLKKKTSFAAVPGALVGALPPAIGWTAGGGSPADPGLFALSAFFFLWQVPHFWLLLIERGNEYARAGLPSLTKVFSNRQLARLTFSWTIATAAAALALPLFFLAKSLAAAYLFIPASLLLCASACVTFRKNSLPAAHRAAFRGINAYLLVIMLILSLGAIFA